LLLPIVMPCTTLCSDGSPPQGYLLTAALHVATPTGVPTLHP